MKNPLRHYHKWTEIILGHGKTAKLRRCACGTEETYMLDRTKKAFVWVPGNFLEDTESPIFVMAGTYETWLKAAQFLNDEFHGVEVRRIEGENDFEEMLKIITPRIFLTEDWIDCEYAANPRFRAILMYR
jgi:hypothetical protein